MATYAIGDIQGCYAELSELLEKLRFDPAGDRLWLLGDLVNRGPDSLRVVRLVRSLGDSAVTVLGNHDLHFLAIALGGHSLNKSDTFVDLLNAAEVEEIADWYCAQRLIVVDEALGYAMAHAGIPHVWDLGQALELAAEVEQTLSGEDRLAYFATMYGNKPDYWSDDFTGMDRLRVITNYLTRMRLLDQAGRMNFSYKGKLNDAPRGWRPWYEMRMQQPLPIKLLFGHWAALEGGTGFPEVVALDTGCVWGRELTAMCLESGELCSVPSRSA